MSFAMGIGALILAAVMAICAIPFAFLMCLFAADSGQLSRKRGAAVFLLCCVPVLFEAWMLAKWGWGLVG